MVITLLNFANKLYFELPVHIDLYENQDEIVTIHSNTYLLFQLLTIPLIMGKPNQNDNTQSKI